MPTQPWLPKAIFYAQFCADQIDQTPNHPSRGVLASSDPGVSVIYASDADIGRIKVALVSENIEILGEANAPSSKAYLVALLVRSMDVTTLEEIVIGAPANRSRS